MTPKSLLHALPLVALLASPAFAVFPGGVETFNGPSLNTSEWQSFNSTGTQHISQNNALTINCLDTSFADYTTLSQTVAVGQQVTVDVTHNQSLSSNKIYLYLTNNSAGTTRNANFDTYHLCLMNDLSMGDNLGYQFGNGSGSEGNGFVPHLSSQPVGTTYHYNIQRLTSSDANFVVYDGNWNILGQRQASLIGLNHILSPYPGDLYIALGGQNNSVTFDNVTVSAIPEPASLALAAAFLPLLLARRPRRAS